MDMQNLTEQLLQESANLQKALDLVRKAHAGQKYGNKPYLTHVKDVRDAGKQIFGAKFDVKAQIASLLHDTLEDTHYTLEDLKKMGFDDDVLSAVSLVTKDKGLSYFDNIRKIINSGNTRAMMVKYADNWVNFTGDKSKWTPEKREKSQAKYKKSLQMIKDKVGHRHEIPEGLDARYEQSMGMLAEALEMYDDE
ncbi:MAG: hypothetical protein WCY93_07805 [Anaerolineaceae bacterium]